MPQSHSLTPLSDSEADATRATLVQYWNAIAQLDDLAGALGDLVHDTEAKVTELLQTNRNCDVAEASVITARFDYLRRCAS